MIEINVSGEKDGDYSWIGHEEQEDL